MRYLHTMLRVTNLEKALDFYCQGLGMVVVKKSDYPDGRFTLVFLRSADDPEGGPALELTHNWDTQSYQRGDAFGHVAYRVASISKIQEQLQKHGYDLSWGPGKAPNGLTTIAFVDDPDGYEIELIE